MVGDTISMRIAAMSEGRNNVLAIPHSIVAYNSKNLYNSYLILEGQLAQIDPKTEPNLYSGLNRLVQRLFNSWVSLGEVGDVGCPGI